MKLLSMRFAIALLAIFAIAELANAQGTPFSDWVTEFAADENYLRRSDDRAWSTAGFDRQDKLLSDWLGRLAGANFDALDPAGKVDYVLLRNYLESERAEIVRYRQRLDTMNELLAFRATIHELETARLRGEAIQGAVAAGKVSELARQVEALTKRVQAVSPPKEAKEKEPAKEVKKNDPPAIELTPAAALQAAEAVGELKHSLEQWFKFYDGYSPELSWWLKKPCEDAGKQLEEYRKKLREQIAKQKGQDDDPIVGQPIGAEALEAKIRFEFLPYSAKELISIGERELAWGEQEMIKAAREMGLGDDWKAALAKVKSEFVPPGEQDELVATIGREATEFVKKHQFATIPPLCEETWNITMISPQMLKVIPYAAYSTPNVMVAYANEAMKQEDKLMVMRGNNRAFTRLTTMHELIPGHHLQIYYAARHNTHRSLFRTMFYVEGWALYCELQMWRLGWARTPEERIGMLFWRMNRAARIVVSLKFHLGEMTPEQMVDFLIDRVGHERFGATSEVRRFMTAPPLYQAGYLLGGLQLMALYQEVVGSGAMTDQQFHDTVLKENTMPIEILRSSIRKLPLHRDARPSWRFNN